MSKELTHAIVTVGGTREPLDDVRFITNFSTGKFGYAIAKELSKKGFNVTLASPQEVPVLAGGQIPEVNHKNFTSTESLRQILLSENTPAVIFHAAAVSDYRPKNVTEGKIPSANDELTIVLERTPKILSELRGHYGKESFLVGFKLLSGSSRNELIRVALEQNKKNHLNLTVANDLRELGNGRHPVILVTAEGGALGIDGTREEVAQNIVEFVKKRSRVTWYHSEKRNLPSPTEKEKSNYRDALEFAQKTGLLYDSSGNVSVRTSFGMIVSPRQVDKSITKPEEASLATVDHEKNEVYFDGKVKSSIDTAVCDAVYKNFPNVKTLLHFHSQWGKSLDTTTFPYPCGVKEEAAEIVSLLDKNNIPPDASEFAIELLHHGVLMALPEGGIGRLEKEWMESVNQFNKHLVDINHQEFINKGKMKPIFANTQIVGIYIDEGQGSVVFLNENARGKSIGKKVVEQLIERQNPIYTLDECGVRNFYKKFGFSEVHQEDGSYILYPPKPAPTDPIFHRVNQWRVG